jgi:hypothetical protein
LIAVYGQPVRFPTPLVTNRKGTSGKKKKKRGYRVCSSGYAATDTS